MTEQELPYLLERIETAMRTEGCTREQAERVLNRLVYGHPLGAEAHIATADVKAELRRQVLEAYDLPKSLTDAWAANHAGMETGEAGP